ncbi:MAG TPA: hypothetical protein VF200_00815 [Woeseiaceae bacterium]
MSACNHPSSLSALACAIAIAALPRIAGAEYELSSYTDPPGGAEIARGDYAAAITAASRRVRWPGVETALVAATNLCVAHTVRREFEAATAPCNEAVALARRSEPTRGVHARTNTALARALSNRGVLRALAGDPEGAARDFRAALRRTRSWDGPERNIAQLERASAQRVAAAAEE